MTDQTFRWHDLVLPYWDHPYNNTRNNERAVELPIAAHWLGRLPLGDKRGLEVGNVLGHYGHTWGRRIVDLHEEADGVENIDVADIEGTFPWIVCISTLEHVGADDRGGFEPLAAVEALFHLRSLLAPGGRMLVTIPFGANPELDSYIAVGVFGVTRQCTLHRQHHGDEPPTWVQAPEPVAPLRSPDPLIASAASVWIGEW